MPQERSLLLISMALQGAVSLTFGLAFLGLWKGFHRPTAIRWALAWLMYALGVIFAALGIGLRFGAGWPPVGLAVLGLPLQLGVVLFRAGTDSLTESGAPRAKRYAIAGIAIVAIIAAVRQIDALGVAHLPPTFGPFILPRLLMGVSYAWALWPLRTVVRTRWAEGVALMAVALACLSVRMFGAIGFEAWQIAHGVSNRPESALLTIAQVCLLIVFGVATALVLVEAERLEAVRAADTLRATADALRASENERDGAERALRKAEERTRFALDTSRVGVWEGNPRTDEFYWSETQEAMHGLAPGTFGRTFDAGVACVHPDDRDDIRRTVDRAVRERKEDVVLEYRTIWPNGTEHWIRATGHYTFDEAGIVERAIGVAVDVTQQRFLEDQLRQAQKMDAIGQLAGGIAHDFNTMLTAIMGYGELVLNDMPDGDARRNDVDEILKAGQRAAILTQQLLAFSRKQVLSPRVLHLTDVVSSVTPMLRRLLGETIDLRTTMSDLGRVKADAGQVEQVLMNLAVNARDAMPDRGRLTIDTADVVLNADDATRHRGLQPGPHVLIAVSDTGHGMDAATQRRVFEPFFTTKPKGQGTGLGLATVYGIVKQSGGYISVSSVIGRGTTFQMYLPRTDEVEEEAQPQAIDRPTHRGTETILLVEDEDLVREFVSRALRQCGYTVHAVRDPREALDFAATYRDEIHLVLTDVVLPGMSGPATAAQVVRRHPESAALYMSGYADDAIVHHGVLDANLWFLPKPFTVDTLARKVRDVLDAKPIVRA
jgi:signal transduction histidine kinase/ActR/RegA family two-component response regulator